MLPQEIIVRKRDGRTLTPAGAGNANNGTLG